LSGIFSQKISGQKLSINFNDYSRENLIKFLEKIVNILPDIENSILIKLNEENREKSFLETNFISRKLKEYGYEYNVVNEIFFDNTKNKSYLAEGVEILIFADENFI